MSQPALSVIVPVYNVGKYLRPCLDSIMAQTFSNFEAILVDDGSTDNSGAVCDEYAARDNRFVALHQQNGGVSSARNAALGISRGEWVGFVDADDLVLPNGFETLMASTNESIDLVSASYERYENESVIPEKSKFEDKILPKEDFMTEICKLRTRCCERYLFTKIFRKSIIDEYALRFNEKLAYREDVHFIFQFLTHCNRDVSCVGEHVYAYFRRSTGAAITHTSSFTPKSMDMFYSMEMVMQMAKEANVSKTTVQLLKRELIYAFNHIQLLIKRSGRKDLKAEKSYLWKHLAANLSKKEFVVFLVKKYLGPFYVKMRSLVSKKMNHGGQRPSHG